MIEWIKTQSLKISLVVNVLELILISGLIVYFVVLGKGIIINNVSNSTSNSTSNSYANSGSLSIGYIGGDYRGNWELQRYVGKGANEFEACNDCLQFLSTLDPVQFMNAKVVINKPYYYVIYPSIVSVQNETHKTKKIVNGKEIL